MISLKKSALVLGMTVLGGAAFGPSLYAAPASAEGIDIDEYPLAITPPKGWVVQRKSSGMSIVIQRPVTNEKRSVGQIYYRPNITATVVRYPRYIDKQGSETFLAELTELYRLQRIDTYSIQNEVQFVDHTAPEKGFVVYSTANLGGIKVTQMHLVISGAQRSAVITYSDLESRFAKDDAEFRSIYDSMLSARLEGVQPHRYEQVLKYGVIAIIALIFFSTVISVRRTSMQRLLALAERGDIILDDDQASDDLETIFAQVEVIEEDDLSPATVESNNEVSLLPVTNPRRSIAR